MITIKKKLVRDILRYTFFLSLFFWILITIYIGYQYVWVSSTQVTTKGGTFVEGIFGNTSYLPYLRNDIQSNFYQGLLFNSCLKPSYDNNNATYIPNFCTVTTKDNQNYTVSLNKGFIWSDGTPVSLEDIYFTYNDILRNNMWELSLLSQYATTTVVKDTSTTLQITFPNKSSDNILFFTNYILPQHILKNAELSDYKSLFAFKPVYSNCANLVAQSNDEYSLVFNLVNCNQTNLNFYQVKNMVSFDTFKQTINNGDKSIIDAYVGDETLDGYMAKRITTNQLTSIFFNTRSDKLRVRGRRALGGLIKHNFYSSGYESYLKKNNDGLFDVFQSTGAGVKDLLNREYNENIINKNDLIDINIQSLVKSISIKGINQKLVYFIDTGVSLPTEFVFDRTYDRITMEYKGKTYTPKHFVKGGRSGWYTFGLNEKTLGTGLNKYSIYGYDKNKKTLLASLDIYNVIPEMTEEETIVGEPVKFTVVYYSTYINDFVEKRLQEIFTKAGIEENFIFEKITTPQELQGRLVVGDYDLLINTVDMGLKNDFTKLFSTDKSEINPSQYQNQKLTTLLKQYSVADESSKKKPLTEINSIYSKDMPLIILGQEYLTINFKPHIIEKLFSSGSAFDIDKYNRREYIYKNIKLVKNMHIDGKKIWNIDNFSKFITDALQ
ncbi:MAG TPA: ABC transporter substrate-binding protein [Candidatus Absconditabacterales bacterium]|nr:ABC transporter substrate-binding protein [Candidatus Absconditabacterales bacterium]